MMIIVYIFLEKFSTYILKHNFLFNTNIIHYSTNYIHSFVFYSNFIHTLLTALDRYLEKNKMLETSILLLIYNSPRRIISSLIVS